MRFVEKLNGKYLYVTIMVQAGRVVSDKFVWTDINIENCKNIDENINSIYSGGYNLGDHYSYIPVKDDNNHLIFECESKNRVFRLMFN